jgi:hypothetical protein
MSANPIVKPYSVFANLRKAGWFRNFDHSGGGHLCVSVFGAPKIGSSPGGRLFAGHWTKHDGTSIYQRSNMDRTWTTVVLDPNGNVAHSFITDTLSEAGDEIHKLNII